MIVDWWDSTFDAFLLRLNNELAWFAIFMCTTTWNSRLRTEWYSFLGQMNILNCYSTIFLALLLRQVFEWKYVHLYQERSLTLAFMYQMKQFQPNKWKILHYALVHLLKTILSVKIWHDCNLKNKKNMSQNLSFFAKYDKIIKYAL